MANYPLPKFHFQEDGFPVDASVNCTTSGAQPDVLSKVKSGFNCPFTNKIFNKKNKNKAAFLRDLTDKGVKKFKFFKDRILDILKSRCQQKSIELRFL